MNCHKDPVSDPIPLNTTPIVPLQNRLRAKQCSYGSCRALFPLWLVRCLSADGAHSKKNRR